MSRIIPLAALTAGMFFLAAGQRATSVEPECVSCDCKVVGFHKWGGNIIHMADYDMNTKMLTLKPHAYAKTPLIKQNVYAAVCSEGDLTPTGNSYYRHKWLNAPFTRDCSIAVITNVEILAGTANITGITADHYDTQNPEFPAPAQKTCTKTGLE